MQPDWKSMEYHFLLFVNILNWLVHIFPTLPAVSLQTPLNKAKNIWDENK